MSAEKPKGSWGGRRAGAGRKSVDGAEIVFIATAYLDQDTLDLVRELGGGNDSLGIRLMARELLRLRKAAKGITSTKHAPVTTPAQNVPQPRNPLLRQKKEEAPAPTGPTWRTGVPVSNDWEVD